MNSFNLKFNKNGYYSVIVSYIVNELNKIDFGLNAIYKNSYLWARKDLNLILTVFACNTVHMCVIFVLSLLYIYYIHVLVACCFHPESSCDSHCTKEFM